MARRLYSGEITVDEAETELSGTASTTAVKTPATAEDVFARMESDPMSPDENDVMHLDVVRGAGKISTEDFRRLVAVMS